MNPIIRRTGLFIALLMGLGMVGGGASWAQSAVTSGTSAASPALKPQMIVTPVAAGSSSACGSPALLREFQAHLAAGEAKASQAMLANQDCMTLQKEDMFRIVTVQGSMVEFVLFTSRSPKGYWAVMESMKPVK